MCDVYSTLTFLFAMHLCSEEQLTPVRADRSATKEVLGDLIGYEDQQAFRDWYLGGLGSMFWTRTRKTLG